jgi:hypothetical protein
MWKLNTHNKPRSKFVRDAVGDAHCVRVYKNLPDSLILQLWSGKRYTLIALAPDEARAIAHELVAVADIIAAPIEA